MDWIERASLDLWRFTKGVVSKRTLDALRNFVLTKYSSQSSHVKVLGLTKSFLKYLTKTRLDTRYYAFELFLDKPKSLKERKNITRRIITKEDIEYVLDYINQARKAGLINRHRATHYSAFVLFAAFTGQRSVSTVSRLKVVQFREALRWTKPVLLVEAEQDKIRMAHYVPLHQQVIEAMKPLLVERKDDELIFEYHSLAMWLKRRKIPLKRCKAHFVLGDLRKFAEQHGDILEWEQSNRAYILTHGLSGIEWAHYRHPLPDSVYDIYMKYWGGVFFES